MTHSINIGARVFRGNTVEAIHYASVVVVGADNKPTDVLGDPYEIFAARSAVKPFQALPLVMSGGIEKYGFTTRQLAITCASHNGTDEHREVVMANLRAAGNKPEDLQCGTHWPIWMQQVNEYPHNGEDRDPVRHNCSGKHSGFLALSRLLGEDPAGYLDPAGRVQQLVRDAVAAMCEVPPEGIVVGIDGCSAPVFALPLFNLALGFKKLANGEAGSNEMARAATRIRDAMYEHPKMISGDGRLDYDLARSFPGNLVCKIGAESVEALGFADPPMGIVVKIHDGNTRALGPVVIAVLKELGFITDIEEYPFLKAHERPAILNNRELVTGNVVAERNLLKRV